MQKLITIAFKVTGNLTELPIITHHPEVDEFLNDGFKITQMVTSRIDSTNVQILTIVLDKD